MIWQYGVGHQVKWFKQDEDTSYIMGDIRGYFTVYAHNNAIL
jgi:hypothetical protein